MGCGRCVCVWGLQTTLKSHSIHTNPMQEKCSTKIYDRCSSLSNPFTFRHLSHCFPSPKYHCRDTWLLFGQVLILYRIKNKKETIKFGGGEVKTIYNLWAQKSWKWVQFRKRKFSIKIYYNLGGRRRRGKWNDGNSFGKNLKFLSLFKNYWHLQKLSKIRLKRNFILFF